MVEEGQTIRVHYKGTLDNGELFDSSEGREPLEFEVGAGTVIPGFEKGVLGMTVGEKKTIHIPVEEAYGEPREEMIMQFKRDQLPEDMEPEVGMQLYLQGMYGQSVPAKVTAFTDEYITVHAKHPLAGQNLKLELELVEIL